MDPDANLKEQIRIASRIASDSESDYGPRASLEHDAARLAELVIALNDWIKGGGFLPASWGQHWRGVRS